MKSFLQTVVGGIRRSFLAAVTVGAVMVASVQDAAAQTAANDGVAEIVSALEELKPDLTFVVIAGIAIALIGIGASVAISIGKRLMGK